MNVILITGCNGGIGLELCKKFNSKKWCVVGTDINDSHDNKYLDRFVKCDLSNEQDIVNIFDSIKNNENRLDCVINNAAYQICKSFEDTTGEEFKSVLNCNVVAPFLIAKYGLKFLKESKGSIINIGSVHATNTSDKIMAYACSKASIVGLTRNMAIELAKYDIRVNSVSPGAIETPMLKAGLSRGHIEGTNTEKLVENLGKKHIIGRVGYTYEVANLVYYLASKNKSGNITGSNFVIDGGATIKLSTE